MLLFRGRDAFRVTDIVSEALPKRDLSKLRREAIGTAARGERQRPECNHVNDS